MKFRTSSSSAPATARSRRPTRRCVVAMLGARYAAASAMYGTSIDQRAVLVGEQ